MGGTSVALRPTGPGQLTDDESHSDIEVAPSEIEVLENQFQESCIITRDDEPLGPCRVLRSLTNGNSVEQLEYAWGVKKGELGLDTRHNEICLRLDLQKTFETGNWALVPHMDVLKEVATRTLLLTQSTKPRPLYTQWFPNQVYNYQFFHFRGAPNVLTRVSDEPGKDFELYRAPFDKVPVVQAQVHPYFAICDVAQKSFSHQFSSGSGATKLGQIRPDLQDCVDLCAAIFSQWMNVRVPAEAPKPVAPSSRDRTISLGGASLDAQELARQQKRLRKLKEKKLHRVSISNDLRTMSPKDLPPMSIVGDFPPTASRKKPLAPPESSVEDSPVVPQPQVTQVMEEIE